MFVTTCRDSATLVRVAGTRLIARILPGPESVAAARRLTKTWFDQWGLADQTDNAVLAVSELAGNAFRHGRGPVRLLLWTTTVGELRTGCCAVSNVGSWREPARDDDLPEWGRGLLLVHAVADSVTVRPARAGRTVIVARFVAKPE